MPLDHQHSVISSSDFISYLCNLNPVYLIFFFEHFSILTWTSLINSLSLILKEILIQRKKFQKYVNWMTNISVIQKVVRILNANKILFKYLSTTCHARLYSILRYWTRNHMQPDSSPRVTCYNFLVKMSSWSMLRYIYLLDHTF